MDEPPTPERADGPPARGGAVGPPRPFEVRTPPMPIARFRDLMDPEDAAEAAEAVERAVAAARGRVVWHVNSTARGGGVAEMMGPLIGYARDAGVDARWMVIGGTPDFFAVTKRLHNMLHADPGDGGDLGDAARAVYEAVLRDNATELAALVRAGDVVVLHDPQTAGMIPAMRRDGATVVWRSHIGHEDLRDPYVARAWDFLAPYLAEADATVFTRPAYVPDCCQDGRVAIIRPTIDPFSPKNQDLEPEAVRAILVRSGIAGGPDGRVAPVFRRSDGTPGRVDRGADILRTGPAPSWDVPLVVQVSRWDRLKDPMGVMEGFVRLEAADAAGASLVLAGPVVTGVADDPEGPAVLAEVTRAWRALPHERRCRVQIVCLPMADPGENAAIVNALQRQATVVVQKSLQEGFGLTVAEAMWKSRPVVASAVGGIVDQITDGRDGVLLADPADRDAFASALGGLLRDPAAARRLGEAGRERVRRESLGMHGLVGWARLVPELIG